MNLLYRMALTVTAVIVSLVTVELTVRITSMTVPATICVKMEELVWYEVAITLVVQNSRLRILSL